MKVLTGSRAAATHYNDFYRPCKDWDYLTDEDYPREPGKEYHKVTGHKGLELLFASAKNGVLHPQMLYTQKVSHSFWNINWPKTMRDIYFYQQKGLKINESIFNFLYEDWIEIHGKKRAYLNKKNEEFFIDNVKRVYVHDSIHEAMAYNDKPMYMSVKKDMDKALISEELFNKLPREQQLQLCREEAYVTALERVLIPKDMKHNPDAAYRIAMQLLCTSMTKGFYPKFIVLNWLELYKPDIDYVAKFKENQEKLIKL